MQLEMRSLWFKLKKQQEYYNSKNYIGKTKNVPFNRLQVTNDQRL